MGSRGAQSHASAGLRGRVALGAVLVCSAVRRVTRAWACSPGPDIRSSATGVRHVLVPQAPDRSIRRRGASGRATPLATAAEHAVLKRPLRGPYPEGTQTAIFGLAASGGGAQVLADAAGIWITAVGYAGGVTPNPTYEEVCSGMTGHNEVVLVAFDPSAVSFETLLRTFWKARSDAGHAAGQRCRHAVSLRHLPDRSRPARDRGGLARGLWHGLVAGGLVRSRRKSSRPARSTSPRITTSSIWRRTRAAIAGLAAPACRVPWGFPSRADRTRRNGPVAGASA